MRKLRLNREDSTDIGFATSCLTASVLTFEEFKDWLNEIICATDDYPHYIFDILDLEKKFDYTLHVRRILGFQPGADLSQDEYRAVSGIAYKRFSGHRSDIARKDTAVAALTRQPQIEAMFRELFPEIAW